MMLFGCCVALAVLSTAQCEEKEIPLTRQKRGAFAFAGMPWGFGGVGPTFPFPGFPYVGFPQPQPQAAAPSVADYPRPSYFPFWPPFPVFEIQKPWYEGPNVCTEEKKANAQQPDDLQSWLNQDFPQWKSDFSHEQQNCQGSGSVYACITKSSDSTGSTLVATKYTCCYGFVRDPNGPGCIESKDKGGKVAPIANERIYYGIAPDSRSSSKSSASAGSVDKVPIQ